MDRASPAADSRMSGSNGIEHNSPEEIVSPQCCQVITGDKEFNPGLEDYVNNKWHLDNLGFNYHVVSIMGSQSTGKSTLLNGLFGTTFNVMDDSERKQTTKGVWFSISNKGNIIIVDVEGTDGRERGDDKEFERKSSLFSLAISEVLIVNVWESQVGLYNGSNMGLLRTVFDVNLHIFRDNNQSKKTCLLFVIRDFSRKTHIEKILECLICDLESVWKDIVKPRDLKDANLGDYFEIEIEGVPHMIYERNMFDEALKRLFKRFYDSNSESYLFKAQNHKRIPSDGFAAYTAQIWSIIKTSEELDLPSQRHMLANFRCNEITSKIMDEIDKKALNIEESLNEGSIIIDLKNTMDNITSEALESFDLYAFRYSEDIYEEKRAALVGKLYQRLCVCYNMQVRNLLAEIRERTVEAMKDLFEETKSVESFAENVSRLVYCKIALFSKECEDLRPNNSNWVIDNEKEELSAILKEEREKLIEEKIEATACIRAKECASKVEPLFFEVLEHKDLQIWHKVLENFKNEFEVADGELRHEISTKYVSEKDASKALDHFPVEAFKCFLHMIKQEIEDIKLVNRVVEFFIADFMYDQKGVIRTFDLRKDVDTSYLKAKSACEAYARLLSKIDIRKEELPQRIHDNKVYLQD